MPLFPTISLTTEKEYLVVIDRTSNFLKERLFLIICPPWPSGTVEY